MTTTPPPAVVDLSNVQGDIIGGFPKKTQALVFFTISNVPPFKAQLKEFVSHITTSSQVKAKRADIRLHKATIQKDGEINEDAYAPKPPLLPVGGINVSFSAFGLTKLGINVNDESGDSHFNSGQFADAELLGDPGMKDKDGKFIPNWEPAFKSHLDGVFIVTAESHATLNKELSTIDHAFNHGSIHKVTTLHGDVRPGKESGHEHFGWKDGISNPTIIGIDDIPPIGDPHQVPPSSILTGQDPASPAWLKDGSFLCFRYLFQNVPEFDKFRHDNPIVLPGLPRDKGSELLGARMVGRWKNGTPIELSPTHPDPDLTNANNFQFKDQQHDQTRCPFAAHIRKTFPRDDLEALQPRPVPLDNFRIMRRGIPFGPELTDEERHHHTTKKDRGLLFLSYQGNLNAFTTIQKTWADTATFPPGSATAVPPVASAGIDPIIGQVTDVSQRNMSGLNPQDATFEQSFPVFVSPHGGEYFFSPSIQSLKESISA